MADVQERLKNVTRTQKAAVLMMLFGEQAAASILRNMSPREVQHLGAAMYSVGDIDSDTLDAVVEEFLGAVRAETGIGLGAADYVKTVMTDALGDEKAQSVISRINPMDTQKPIEILDWMDARAIAELISDEHPQIMALVIACLDYALAAEVLTLLPDDVQGDLVQRIASLNTVQPEPLKDLEQVMQRKFKQSSTMRASQIGGINAAARILNFTRTDMEQRIMRDLRKGDKDMQQSIEESMFVFDNLIKSDDRSMQTLMRSVETELLVLALKGADEALKEKLLACMSTRAAANIRDEMEAMGPVRLTEVQNAQKEIVAVARRMADEGTIVLAGRGGEQMV
ncbi:flagellar motor switch protein FliG [Marivivens donghaensis]|uniref:Flagellar motor switch protein FliG n=1 Tax=Marivivens donghaensis TaxID=1699413 RepID=A0ABX0VSL2_9RHOB|nr:flagellar motor switch protein FliG [Marivivens donghaensis]NIY70889.1 flagellar motor switch protein FliG [Marivivens donghaensis]